MSKAKTPKRASPSQPPAGGATVDLGIPKCGQALWARVACIHALLCQEQKFTAPILAKRFETTPRTIRRALRFLRDSLHAPLTFDQQANTFRYTEPWLFLPLARVTSDEKFVLKLITRCLPDEVNSPLGESLQSALKKLDLVVGGDGEFGRGSLEEVVLPALLGAAEQRHLPTIQEAMSGRRELRISYIKANATKPEAHVIQPHRLRYIRQRWVLLAHDVTRGGALRTFLLRRVGAAALTLAVFERPKGFDPDKILDGNFGAYTGAEDHDIRIVLHGPAAAVALDEPWHPSQRLSHLAGGSVEITLRLNNLVDIKYEILRWGEHAEVLAPLALRTAVHQSHAAAAAKYRDARE